ncbi:MAG TPA: YerC/YecD family TrpR-related protein [Bacillota bacterium]
MAQKRRQSRQVDGLIGALLSLRDADEGSRFLEDLCTGREMRTLANRWEAAQMLEAGLTYEAIEAKTGMSSATISRIRRALSEGAQGYRLVLERQKRKAIGQARSAARKKAGPRPAKVGKRVAQRGRP